MSRLLWYPGHELLLADIARAENGRIVDSDGKTYIDLESGVWCTSIGHAHPRILRVIVDQISKIGHAGFNYTSGIVEEAAEEILTLLGHDGGKCVFLCSGSEAIEYGVRVAQSVATRPLLLTMSDSYFGAYGSANVRREEEWYSFDWTACASCPESGSCEDGCPHWEEIPCDRIGGFLLEPGSSSGLVRFPPEKLIRSIAVAVRRTDGLLLVNEVTTGVGRTGRWFGYQHYGLQPDIVAVGKGIGGGYPVSVASFAPRVVDLLGGRSVRYAQSHQNDPLGAAVALEVVRVVREERLIERSAELSTCLVSGLEQIRLRRDRVREVRARGLMIAIEMRDDPDASFTTRVHRELVRRGFVVGKRPGVPVLRIDPPLTIDRVDLEGFLTALDEVLA